MVAPKNIGIIIVISFMIFACATNDGFISSEEAKELSINLQTMRVPPPPRDSSDIRAIVSEIYSRMPEGAMKSEQFPPDPIEINTVFGYAPGDSGSSDSTFLNSGTIFGICRKELIKSKSSGQHMRLRAILERGYELIKDSGSPEPWQISAICSFLATSLMETGKFSEAMYYLDEALKQNLQDPKHPHYQKRQGQILNHARAYGLKAYIFAVLGDYENAEEAIRNAEDNLAYSSNKILTNMVFGIIELAKAQMYFGEGKEDECMESVEAALEFFQSSFYLSSFIPACQMIYINILIRNGKLIEAELYARLALKRALESGGVALSTLPMLLGSLTTLYSEMGRASEAEKIVRAVMKIRRHGGMLGNSDINLLIGIDLLRALVLQKKWDEAIEIVDNMMKLSPSDDPLLSPMRRSGWNEYSFTLNAGVAYIKSGRFHEFAEHFEADRSEAAKILGENHYALAELWGLKGVSDLEQGELEKAHEAFAAAVPILIKGQGVSESQSNLFSRKMRLDIITEAYLRLLTISKDTEFELQAKEDILNQGFRLAESAKASMVTTAIQKSSARSDTVDPILKGKIRKEQDIRKQISSFTVGLSRQLGQTGDLRNEKAIAALRAHIHALREQRGKIEEEINQTFPDYQRLTETSFSSVDEVKSYLRPGEALISLYIGENQSYVWAIPKTKPAEFASVNMGRKEVERLVKSLRSAVEPKDVKKVGDIPEFDVAAASLLYEKFLKPVENGWKSADNLIVVPHGTLSFLPFSLLVTESSEVSKNEYLGSVSLDVARSGGSVSKINRGLYPAEDAEPVAPKRSRGPLFSEYKKVPWLARTHAITKPFPQWVL